MPLKPPFVWRSQKVLRFPVETSSIATCSKARHFCGSVGNYCFWTMAADCFPKHLPSCRCLLFLDVSGSFSLILRRISTRCLLFASILIYILELNAAQAGIMFCFHSASQDFVDLLYIDSRAPARIASHVFLCAKSIDGFIAVYSTRSERNTRMMDHALLFHIRFSHWLLKVGCVLNLLFGRFEQSDFNWKKHCSIPKGWAGWFLKSMHGQLSFDLNFPLADLPSLKGPERHHASMTPHVLKKHLSTHVSTCRSL